MLTATVASMAVVAPTDVLLEGTSTPLPAAPNSWALVANELFLSVLLVELGDVQVDKALSISCATTSSTL